MPAALAFAEMMSSSTSTNNDESSSTMSPPRKRLRRCPNGGGWARTTTNDDLLLPTAIPMPNLPTELWSIIMNALPYSSMIELSSTSRTMLKDVAPRVEAIEVDRAKDLSRLLVAGRFSGVSSVDVACLLLTTDGGRTVLCDEAASQVVPFLASFGGLKEAWVGGFEDADDPDSRIEYHHSICDEPECHEDIFDNFIDDFAKAFECGHLPSDLTISGVTGSSSYKHNNFRCIVDDDDETYQPGCQLCRKICHHFPLRHLVEMGFKDQYFAEEVEAMYWDRCMRVDPPEGTVCFTHKERIAAIVERPGGRELLSEEAMPIALKRWLDFAEQIVRVDGSGQPSRTGTKWDTALDLDLCNAWDEIEAVAPYVNVSAFGYETLIKTIVSHIVHDCEGGKRLHVPLVKRGTLLIMKPTFDKLVSLGFPLHIDDFRCVVRHENGVTLGGDYSDDASEEFDRLGLEYGNRHTPRVIYHGPGYY